MVDTELETLAHEQARMARRLEALERHVGLQVATERPAKPRPVAKPPAPAPRPAPVRRPAPPKAPPPRPAISLEDLLGGRVLAWVGGAAVLLGLAFLLALAISRGWIGEGARTLLAGVGSTGLLVLGVWLHERKSRSDAALAAVATGISGLFLTITVASQMYELVPELAALGLAMGVGAVATSLAVRWDSHGIGWLGIVGALLAPVLAGAAPSPGTATLLFFAAASAVAVLVWRRWDWLALAVFAVATPQWVAGLADGASVPGTVIGLVSFGVLGLVAAVGYELRVADSRLRGSSAFLLALNAAILAGVGWFLLSELDQDLLAKLWLVAMAATHTVVGLASHRHERVSADLGLLSLALGVGLADVAFGIVASGPVLAVGWAASAAGFALLTRMRGSESDIVAAQLGLGMHIALALGHALLVDAPPVLIEDGGALGAAGAASLVALAAGCFVSGALTPAWRVPLDALGLAAVAYLTVLALDGWHLGVALALEAVVLARLAHRGDDVARAGSLAFLCGSLWMALLEAPPQSLVYGLEDPLAAALAVGASVLAGVLVARIGGGLAAGERWALLGCAATMALYLASAAIVTPFQPGGEVGTSEIFELGVRQQGQMLLSVFWAVLGVIALVAGLRRDVQPLRAAALALLAITVGKVFLFDLATLTSIYRVVSFIVLGLLLLGAAFAWQRSRPGPLQDLREVPEGVR